MNLKFFGLSDSNIQQQVRRYCDLSYPLIHNICCSYFGFIMKMPIAFHDTLMDNSGNKQNLRKFNLDDLETGSDIYAGGAAANECVPRSFKMVFKL